MSSGQPARPARLGVLLSGRGSNFLAIADAIAQGALPAEIAVVISNEPEAAGLERARERGFEAVSLPHRGLRRAEHDAGVLAALRRHQVDWVCLAGYLRIVGRELVDSYAERIVNIHPSLLPSFPGLDAQRQAFDHGVKVSGCTVHLVDAGLDTGPIVLQRAVGVDKAASAAEVAALILEQEHFAYVEALRRLLTEDWRVEGRRLRFPAEGSPSEGRPKIS
jgi:phosphoribosylglycinamide formyltransferase-1